jgi:lon-related putative ATP-dependent protease
MAPPIELTAAQLRRRFDPARFEFISTEDAPDLQGIIGQERAARAIEFGLEMPHPGYNVFATGPGGAGKTSIITRFLEDKAASRPIPPDWGYVHNFSDPDRPRAVRLPPGGGLRLRDQVNALLQQVADLLDKTFSGDQYAENRKALSRQIDELRGERIQALERFAIGQSFAIAQGEQGISLTPLKDGQPINQEQFSALEEEEQKSYTARGQAVQDVLERTFRQLQEMQEAAEERFARLDQETTAGVIAPLFERLLAEYGEWPDVRSYLEGVAANIAESTQDFRAKAEATGRAGSVQGPAAEWLRPRASSPFDRYHLNVLVDNSHLAGAPVVVETNPTYGNLIGRVEMRAELGTLVTDFRQIKSGALHRSNGGYLLIDARVLLRQPFAWEALKQALRNRSIRIEEMGQQTTVLATTTLAPESIPLELKVVLVGDLTTYYALYQVDEQFPKLFKVRADFAVEMDWTAENEGKIVSFIRNRCAEFSLPHFDAGAVAQIVEYSGRLVEDQRKLTTRFAHVSDLVQEAAFWAGRAGHALVQAGDVWRAIEEQIYRSNQFEQRMRESITDGTIMVATTGAVVGQVNGLAVLQLGDYAFGRPTRITARAYQGRAGVVNIEREARLSGRIHDKGVLILSGFLGGRYAQDKPLGLSASIAFEQSYDGIDGDSASSTELYALLSSLAELPLRQDIAVTGSVNQHGETQPVGGVTAKVEGFYDVCRSVPGGLTGTQGVILPVANVANLMLRPDVVDAVAEGKFHIWPVATVDEGIELLTGVPAGERDADGGYAADTVNGRVDARLRKLAQDLQNFGRTSNGAGRISGNGEPPAPLDDPTLPGDQPEPETPPGEPDLPGDQPEPPAE